MNMLPVLILATMDESDREFMKRTYIKYQKTMFRMARALTDSYQDAEDVVSNACVSLICKISVLKCLDCNVLEGYIISTVKNTAYMFHRRKKSRKEVYDSNEILPMIADTDTSPDCRIIQECTIEELMSAIEQLLESDQTVIRMKYFEKRSDREIADLFGIQEVSVRSRLTRARKRIYELLGGCRNDCRK